MEKEEFVSKAKQFSNNINRLAPAIKNEEQTKQSLIVPFFSLLGYDVFNPLEFIPEYTADILSIKKGERVDYAIVINGQVSILVETKSLDENLDKHATQINRYFNVVDAKFAIITNGREYRFYTDLEKENIMDNVPFLTIDMSNIKDGQINELFKFIKENFNPDNITSTASDLKYVSQIKGFLNKQTENPNDDFVRLVLDEIGYDGLKRQNVIDEFKPMVSKAVLSLVSERVNSRLSSALNSATDESHENISISSEDDVTPEKPESQIVTTDDELEIYTITKLILSELIETSRVYYRDNTSYFNILIDDNIRRWVLRAYFNSARSWIVLNDDDNTNINFEQPIDIYKYADRIKQVANKLIEK